MLILNQPDTGDLEVITQVHCVCCNCTNEVFFEGNSKEIAAIKLEQLGWRTYERTDEIGGNTCPTCIEDLKEISLEEDSEQETPYD
ncbi:hypothetical protein [Nitrincola iocasae]|uniref:Uncharacterized protein n=1 Tax=Nitrincola iocasae TaxID=2614693 RepID=A0A5J6LCL6_9GAMM|nr:hypothetical protein [Nitrincola iocasae]QEW06327.1 hypothetical protein F5I99_07315 [Nitrincola iocasae]